MTDNIEKLYELAGTKKIPYITSITLNTTEEDYPPFTAEKLLELESYIFQLNYGYCQLERQLDANFKNGKCKNHFFVWMYRIGDYGHTDEETGARYDDFERMYHNAVRKQALAGLVCELWEDLTDTQKSEIKRILE